MTRQEFEQAITVICDSREQRNQVILAGLSQMGIKFKVKVQ
jgi:hypothetical protein